MVFNYFMGDSVDRDVVRQANNVLVARADELWQYGAVSDGALAEIVQARKENKPVRYFDVIANKDIVEIKIEDVILEPDVADKRSLLA